MKVILCLYKIVQRLVLTFLVCNTVTIVKCAAAGCPSVFILTKIHKSLIALGKTPSCQKKRIFSFSKNTERQKQWISTIRRSVKGWNLNNSGICELPITSEDFF